MQWKVRHVASAGVLLGFLLPTPAAGDYKALYCEGLEALNFKQWRLAALMFSEAAELRPEEGMPKVPCRRFREWYIPHYHLGHALFELGFYPQAFAAWRETLGQGGLRKGEIKNLQQRVGEEFPTLCRQLLEKAAREFAVHEKGLARFARQEIASQDDLADLLRRAHTLLEEGTALLGATADTPICRLPSPAGELSPALEAAEGVATTLAEMEERSYRLADRLVEIEDAVWRRRAEDAKAYADAAIAELAASRRQDGPRAALDSGSTVSLAAYERAQESHLTAEEMALESFLIGMGHANAGRCVPVEELRATVEKLRAAGIPSVHPDLPLRFDATLLRAARNCGDRAAVEELLYNSDELAELSNEALVRYEAWLAESADLGLYDRSYALLLGGSQYSRGWTALPAVKEDLAAIRQTLEAAGFELPVPPERSLDGSKNEILKEIEKFISGHGGDPRSRLLFYWAGHGITKTSKEGVELGFLVPAGDPPRADEELLAFMEKAISLDDFKKIATETLEKPVHALFVFDSCYAGVTLRDEHSIPESFDRERVRQKARVYLASGSAGEVSGSSRYRNALLEGLRGCADGDRNWQLTASELGEYLSHVIDDPRPWWAKSRDFKEGDFVIAVKGPVEVFGGAEAVDGDGNHRPRCQFPSWRRPRGTTDWGQDQEDWLADFDRQLPVWNFTSENFTRYGEARDLQRYLDYLGEETRRSSEAAALFAAFAERVLGRLGSAAPAAAVEQLSRRGGGELRRGALRPSDP